MCLYGKLEKTILKQSTKLFKRIFKEFYIKRFVEEELFPHEDLVDKSGEVPIELGKQIEKKSKELRSN